MSENKMCPRCAEIAAGICAAEAKKREGLATAPGPAQDALVQAHKAITARNLADAIRAAAELVPPCGGGAEHDKWVQTTWMKSCPKCSAIRDTEKAEQLAAEAKAYDIRKQPNPAPAPSPEGMPEPPNWRNRIYAIDVLEWVDALRAALLRERERGDRLELCAAAGRRTDGEYRRMGRPDGWTWNESVHMWCRYDQDELDAIKRAESAESRARAAEELLDACKRAMIISTGQTDWQHMIAAIDAARKA